MAPARNNFMVYRASAGSGKTYTLVKEYLKLVLPNPSNYRRILAVTFTNKAAAEMKGRIISRLQGLAATDKELESLKAGRREEMMRLHHELCLCTGLDPDEVRRNARTALHLILHGYSDFAISTIDRFVSRITRTFSYDLHIPQNHELVLDDEILRQEAVAALMAESGSNPAITRMLIHFIRERLNSDRSWDVEKELISFSAMLNNEASMQYLPMLRQMEPEAFAQINTNLKLSAEKAEAGIREAGQMAIKLMSDHNMQAEDFRQGTKGIGGFFESLTKKDIGSINISPAVRTTVEEEKWISNAKQKQFALTIEAIAPKLKSLFKSVDEKLKKYKSYSILIEELPKLALLSAIERRLEEIKVEGGFVLLSDYYRKINEQLLLEPVPFIYQRTGEKFTHFFIDEFQDTSLLQFRNMIPLIENALAAGEPNLLVGDAKQAIYRFRNGEVRQFTNLPKIYNCPELPQFREAEALFGQQFAVYSDLYPGTGHTNFRSAEEVVDFNNRFFSFLMQKESDEDIRRVYEGLTQQPSGRLKGGYVEVTMGNLSAMPVEVGDAVEKICSRGILPGNIAVICRTNKLGAEIASELTSRNIGVVTSDSLLVANAASVRLMEALFRLLADPGDVISAAGALMLARSFNAPMQTKSLHSWLQMLQNAGVKKHGGKALESVLTEAGLRFRCYSLLKLPLYDLCETLVRDFGLNRSPDPCLSAFLDRVNDYRSGALRNLNAFLEYWETEREKASVETSERPEAVRIHTIHKAKGLEFPVVILPMPSESEPGDKSCWISNDFTRNCNLPAALVKQKKDMLHSEFRDTYEEEIVSRRLDSVNQWYVAMTRAEQEMYIIAGMPPEYSSVFRIQAALYEFTGLGPEGGTCTFGKQAGSETFVLSGKSVSCAWKPLAETRALKPVMGTSVAGLWDEDENTGKRNYGTLIHSLLAGVKVAADASLAVEKAVANGSLAESEKETIFSELSRILSHPEVSPWFSPGAEVLTEPGILTPEGELWRPDRVVKTAGRAMVIDFKTGKPGNDHRQQVETYCRLVQKASGIPAEGMLVYTGHPLMTVKVC